MKTFIEFVNETYDPLDILAQECQDKLGYDNYDIIRDNDHLDKKLKTFIKFGMNKGNYNNNISTHYITKWFTDKGYKPSSVTTNSIGGITVVFDGYYASI